MSCSWEDLGGTGRGTAKLDGAAGGSGCDFFERVAYLGVELPDPLRSAIVGCRGSVSERPKVQHSKCCVV